MINEKRTFEVFGYYSDDLKSKSNRRVIHNCEICNKERELIYFQAIKTKYCHSCAAKINNAKTEVKQKISIAHKGKKFSLVTRHKMSTSAKIKVFTDEHRRNMGLSHLGQLLGRLNPNYIDGRKPLSGMIRTCPEANIWRKEIFKRDNFICQKCGEHTQDLEAHHLIRFSIILSKFLKEYNQFSPIEDKEELISLAIKYQPFWDISNGITLCKSCHRLKKEETHDYVQR